MEENDKPAVESIKLGNGNSEKHAILTDLAKKISALDNPVKLNILSLLVESGSLSITDIAKKLDLNFSTAHKYLEQLEAANLVKSKQVAENRLKRVFTIQDFAIELSPKALFKRTAEATSKTKAKFKLFDHDGQLIDFDEEKFSQKYIKRGMPRGTILLALQEALEQAYDGMTLLELRYLFNSALEKKAENVQRVLTQIEADRQHKKTFGYVLLAEHQDALRQHANGDIFIRNIYTPVMLKFSHDIRSIYLHGGVEGKQRARSLGEFLDQIEGAIDTVYTYAKVSHILDSFNYLVAPTINKTLTSDDRAALKKFLQKLNSKGIKFYIGLDVGVPAWTKELPPYYYLTEGKTVISYENYQDIAQTITQEFIKILSEAKLDNVLPVFKVYSKKFDTELIKSLPTCLIANMAAPWQGQAASYSVGARFDTKWKGWVRTVRVGEVQNITLNLPRLAHRAKTEAKFFQNLNLLLSQILDYFASMAEFVTGEFLKYKINFKSAVKEQWDYAHIEDSTYYVAVTGLDEAVYILSGKRLHEDTKLAEKILKECQKVISNYSKVPLRIELKEEPDENVANRFYNLDKKDGVKVDKYSRGASCKDYLASAKLHQYILGGHCVFVPKKEFDFEAFAKAKGGLVKLV